MITLIHLLQHLGLPSGVAIAVVVAGRKLLKGAIAKTGALHNRDRDQPSSRHYR
jgi:hypothetical protein